MSADLRRALRESFGFGALVLAPRKGASEPGASCGAASQPGGNNRLLDLIGCVGTVFALSVMDRMD